MKLPSPRELLHRTPVRVAVGLIGIGVLAAAIAYAGAGEVWRGLGKSAPMLPWVLALEAGMLVCNTFALRALYGPLVDRTNTRGWLRAAMLGYTVGVVAPLGRAAAEASRALLLKRGVGGPRAAVAAVQMQGVVLLANFFASAIAFVASVKALGMNRASIFVAANAALALVLGMSILVVRKRGRPGRLLGNFGAEFDATPGATSPEVFASLAWEMGARVLHFAQCGVALLAVGRAFSPGVTLAVQGTQLVGSTLGDAIPAQLGATEATLVMSASSLMLTSTMAATLALLIHAAQLALAAICGAGAMTIPGGAQMAQTVEVES
ncbi:MAG: flippase-like domain-containing protein [Deltaproteobacteria bacterium]|nr:flippase-like domain-containing protein [Deltaproteobacteria bacterium]